MKNKKNLFYFFENIISYESDVSKIFSKKDNYIPIINSKKNVYFNKNKKSYFPLLLINISIPIFVYVIIEIILFFFKKKIHLV
jgi:hypothetical protein